MEEEGEGGGDRGWKRVEVEKVKRGGDRGWIRVRLEKVDGDGGGRRG